MALTLFVRNGWKQLARPWLVWVILLSLVTAIFIPAAHAAAIDGEAPQAATNHPAATFPLPLDAYPKPANPGLLETLQVRAKAEPFNIVATLLFLGAVVHTFMAPMFTRLSHKAEEEHEKRITKLGLTADAKPHIGAKSDVSFKAQALHFLGEIEAVFGLWVVPLLLIMASMKGWGLTKEYLNHGVNFTEPIFVVIIMAIAASRPILVLAEKAMEFVARLGRGSAVAWWLSILTIGPILGSFITEPAAMTISALLLAHKFYDRKPSAKFAYATIGLLFVNISVGGTLTHFAAPPVLMVATKWDWTTSFMAMNFGWKAIVGILAANAFYFLYFRAEFKRLQPAQEPDGDGRIEWESRNDPIPVWVTLVHLFCLAWTVLNNHYPVLFVGAFLFYLAFSEATQHHQNRLRLRPAMLVGFFLAGLVIHGGLQGWWIEPVLGSLSRFPLFLGAIGLTAFNDNAAITYLASFVPNLSDSLKYAVVAGAVTGGGLTVIANAPNPAGQSILSKYFPNGVSAMGLLLGALIPTVIMALCFILLP
ncbi:MAG: putative Na+/H+ antiporter [Verrucomicrobiales bacterium]